MYDHEKKNSPPLFTATAETLLEDTQKLINAARSTHDDLASAVTPETATFANTLLPIAQEESVRLHGKHKLTFYQHVSPHEQVREASRAAEMKFLELDTELAMREDVCRLVMAARDRDEVLDVESRRYLERQLLKYKRNGLELDEPRRRRLRQIKTELSEAKAEFEKNLSQEDHGVLWFTREELDGLPEDILSSLEKDSQGKLRFTFQPTHVGPTLSCAKKTATRKKVYIGSANQKNANVPLLEKAIVLRAEAARLLGYANHAEFRLEDKMEKSPKKINAFLEDVQARLGTQGERKVARLKQLKREDLKAREEDDDGGFYLWDHSYCSKLLANRDFSLDQEKLAEYFPLYGTVKRMLGIFATIFGMVFTEVSRDDLLKDGLIWHQDVRMFTVQDNSQNEEKEEGEFLGHLYMDLHPRQGKHRQLADLSIHPGFLSSTTNNRIHPATCLITNFPKPTGTKPALLKHLDVWTLFHELGHGIHDLVSKTQFACFHGPETAQDFCEAPSQMLEKWCWTPSMLKVLGMHYSSEDTEAWQKENQGKEVPSEMIPDEVVENLIRSKGNRALFWLSSLHVAVFDMNVHQPASREDAEKMDTTYLWNFLRKKIVGIDGPEALGEGYGWGSGQATFGHLFQGYDAGYYSYLSSQVYACDMFQSGFAADPMSREQGLRYRREVLEKGGSEDEMRQITNFLRREASADAFYKELGLVWL